MCHQVWRGLHRGPQLHDPGWGHPAEPWVLCVAQGWQHSGATWQSAGKIARFHPTGESDVIFICAFLNYTSKYWWHGSGSRKITKLSINFNKKKQKIDLFTNLAANKTTAEEEATLKSVSFLGFFPPFYLKCTFTNIWRRNIFTTLNMIILKKYLFNLLAHL